jgi:hypothetical protein
MGGVDEGRRVLEEAGVRFDLDGQVLSASEQNCG